MILHVDGNSFYASCEQIYRPDLRGKPVAVLSNNDGVIIALNREAKEAGLKRGDVYFKVAHECASRGVTVFSSNYTLYADISRRITSIYREYAPEIEEYSIDESFLFFDGCSWPRREFVDMGHEIKRRIMKEVGMPVCVGAAPTKTLSKLYNKRAKEHGGVFVYDEAGVDALLESTPAGDIWGIGPSRAEMLLHLGIRNAKQLRDMPLYDAKKKMTIQGYATVQELRGIQCLDRVVRNSRECVTSSRQFSQRVYDIPTLESAIVQYTQIAVERLRAQHSEAKALILYLSTCNYYANDPDQQYTNSVYVELVRETSYTADFVKAAAAGLRRIYRDGYGYKTVIVTLCKITPAAMQGNLFIDPLEDVKKRAVMQAVDRVTRSYGRESLSLAKGAAAGDAWQMSRQFLSPCWTTDICAVPGVV
ncbi:MAG: Y-family DNA polymerase [Treponema sp.]|nr:Y-family DNA polymerase [Candidatus Treponema caballi]